MVAQDATMVAQETASAAGDAKARERNEFLALSAELTGFALFDLGATGCVDEYLEMWCRKVPPDVRATLGRTWAKIEAEAGGNQDQAEARVREKIFGPTELSGPAKSLVKMWLLGVWVNPQNQFDQTTVSAQAYRQGLVWAVAGTHPQGAKQPGFGTWADPPASVPIQAGTPPSLQSQGTAL
jgi:hypothetical protein